MTRVIELSPEAVLVIEQWFAHRYRDFPLEITPEVIKSVVREMEEFAERCRGFFRKFRMSKREKILLNIAKYRFLLKKELCRIEGSCNRAGVKEIMKLFDEIEDLF